MIDKYTLNNFRGLPISSNEVLQKLSFSEADVLTKMEDIRVRGTNIDKGIALGKSKLLKTHIIIKSGDELFKVESQINAIDANYVYTQTGLKIPIVCIYSVDFLQ
ncbi:MAG: hypothetical protein CFE21_05585 [Bacteroidetes bacterium B1(2017)]|nr:MAG: hypothetical protein CFE21_05585 [Bacteroidetes bacterium B1(2017)]